MIPNIINNNKDITNINLNDIVMFDLTEYGSRNIRNDPNRRKDFRCFVKKHNDHYSTNLWTFMHMFGSNMYNDCELEVKTSISIIKGTHNVSDLKRQIILLESKLESFNKSLNDIVMNELPVECLRDESYLLASIRSLVEDIKNNI